ncbi:Putative HNHc nuclease [Pilibacter termitis]|uniref:Putative HNHc nuclease n=1 Tax=Pilibacter termitis TaxID=263852 RepID=A0A1T4PCQ1_9ENTE|nr:putative HNHc nuclease [Pilibacter termitis]SJZ89333.1 Putative HNHc nuclease [Pilibacter termitis]
MKVIGKLKSISGDELKIQLDEEINLNFIKLIGEHGDDIEVEVRVKDPRAITYSQVKLGYALLMDISLFTGYDKEEIKRLMKFMYLKDTAEEFAFSKASKVEGTRFLNYLIDFCFSFDVPMKKHNILPENMNRQLFNCLKYRVCAVCGRKGADIHHQENLVGLNSRKIFDHRASKFIALCREHHNEFHYIGLKTAENKYKLKAISLDEHTLQRLHIMTKKQMEKIDRRF